MPTLIPHPRLSPGLPPRLLLLPFCSHRPQNTSRNPFPELQLHPGGMVIPGSGVFLLHRHFSLHTCLLPAEILPVMPSWLARPGGECQGLNTIFVTSGRTRAVSGQSPEFQGSGFPIPFVPSSVTARPPLLSPCGGDNAGQRGHHGHRVMAMPGTGGWWASLGWQHHSHPSTSVNPPPVSSRARREGGEIKWTKGIHQHPGPGSHKRSRHGKGFLGLLPVGSSALAAGTLSASVIPAGCVPETEPGIGRVKRVCPTGTRASKCLA